MAAWRASGQDADEYAAQHDLHSGTLRWWASRGRAEARAKAAGSGLVKVAARSSFLAVRVRRGKAAASADDGLQAEIVLNGGRRVRLVGGLSYAKLGRLLDAIEGGGSC